MTSKLIILRHAHRLSIPEGEVGIDILLSNKGISDAREFARKIQGNILSITSSPIERCVQTAKAIAEEHHIDTQTIPTSTQLGNPGFFIEDADLAWEHWQKKGENQVNQHLLTGKSHWTGFHDLKSAALNVFSHIQQLLLSKHDGVHIWVTHDTILAALTAQALPDKISMATWPDFLGRLEVELSAKGHLKFNYTHTEASTSICKSTTLKHA